MPSRRDLVRMDAAEVAAYLAAGRTMTVSSHFSDGAVHLAAMWYAVDDDAPVFWTYRTAQKTRNLERDPRISALVESGTTYAELAGVSLVGTAELLRDPDEVARIGALVATRYGDAAVAPADLAHVAAKRVGVRIHVERTLSWDHRKLAGTY